MNRLAVRTVALLLFCCPGSPLATAADYHVDSFKRIQLTDVYYSEGANIGDINQDGHHGRGTRALLVCRPRLQAGS